ncbi:hypothetical protein rsdtw13_34420 [Clostridium sp. TW13]|uniref:Uncharacterized protein n=1 Tax=Inconstantimicrobium mannanitabidum TaxID=1604901 RepID=A0ACB5RGJ8_9CLOT|nr:hypothetical protein rsdtw13_34420 [Clostridium sp. TW13]
MVDLYVLTKNCKQNTIYTFAFNIKGEDDVVITELSTGNIFVTGQNLTITNLTLSNINHMLFLF